MVVKRREFWMPRRRVWFRRNSDDELGANDDLLALLTKKKKKLRGRPVIIVKWIDPPLGYEEEEVEREEEGW